MKGSYESLNPPAQGGIGVDCRSSTLFASGSSLTGGDTGDWQVLSPQDPTASGLVVRNDSDVQHLATTFEAGGGLAPPGTPIDSSGTPSTIEDLDDVHRALQIPAAIRELSQIQVSYSGEPYDLVLVRVSSKPDWSLEASLNGVQHLGAPTFDLVLGAAGSEGTLDVTLLSPRLPPGVDAATAFAQPVVAEFGGALRLGAPSSIVIVDASIPQP